MTQFDPRSVFPSEPSPEQPTVPPPVGTRARRRRARRTFFPSDAEGQAAMLTDLARRAYPSYEFYIFALLGGAILGAGFFFDAQAVLIFGALSAPLLTSWVGMTLASITGSFRLFSQTFAALIVSAVIVFIIGLMAGFASTPFQPITLNEVYIHSRLWVPDLVVLALGSILLVVTFVRTESPPYLPSAMLAYELFLPVSAAGFGIGAGLLGVWPQAGLVFLVHLAWASIFGMLTFIALRFRPLSFSGLIFSAVMLLLFIAILVGLTGLGRTVFDYALGAPTPTVMALAASPTFSPPPPTATDTPSPTLTLRPTQTNATLTTDSVPPTLLGGEVTFPPTITLTPTATIEPTPILAKIASIEGGGAYMRKTPGGEFLATLDNGVVVEVLGETEEVKSVTWVKIAAIKNGILMEGWIIQSVLVTATPIVNWEPTGTPTPTP